MPFGVKGLGGMKGTMKDFFYKCTETKLMKDGRIEIHCKRGLWCVSGTDRQAVEQEAMHYFRQYFVDGEYESLLA